MKGNMKPNSKRQAILWGRFSSDKQSDGDSKDRQNRLNRALAQREGITILGEYFDEGVSVKDGATELFKKVIAELPNGVGIICENLDRINRGHPWRAKAYIADILDSGHWIITSADGREYNSESIGEIGTMVMGDITANLAFAENSKRIKRVREAKAQAIDFARQGKPSPLGRWLPAYLRYDFETEQYVINQEIKAIIKRIFTEYTQGKGASNIARGLNRDKVLTFGSKKPGAWSRTTIGELLRYEGVIGVLNIKGERIPNAWPSAIDEALFFQVKKMLASNVNRGGNYASEKVNNLFRGLCHCAECGSAMKVYKHTYLGCVGYREGRKAKDGNPCTVKTLIPFREMEYEFIRWFIPQAKDLLLGRDDSSIKIETLEAKLTNLSERINKTLEYLDNPQMPKAELDARLLKLQAEKNLAEADLATAKAERSHNSTIPHTLSELDSLIDEAAIKDNQQVRSRIASLVPTLVANVDIDITDKIEPSFTVHLIDGQTVKWTYDASEIADTGKRTTIVSGHYVQAGSKEDLENQAFNKQMAEEVERLELLVA